MLETARAGAARTFPIKLLFAITPDTSVNSPETPAESGQKQRILCHFFPYEFSKTGRELTQMVQRLQHRMSMQLQPRDRQMGATWFRRESAAKSSRAGKCLSRKQVRARSARPRATSVIHRMTQLHCVGDDKTSRRQCAALQINIVAEPMRAYRQDNTASAKYRPSPALSGLGLHFRNQDCNSVPQLQWQRKEERGSHQLTAAAKASVLLECATLSLHPRLKLDFLGPPR